MNRKRILFSASILILVSALIIGTVLAWVVIYRRSMIVVVGDAHIKVQGWYDLVGDANEIDFDANGIELLSGEKNFFTDLPEDKFLAFKFKVTNLDGRDATLSMRLSNMFDYIFDNFKSYAENNGTLTQEQENNFTKAVEDNNGRLTFVLNNIYYENGDGTTPLLENGLPDSDIYLWKCSRGERFIGTGGNDLLPPIPKIPLKGNSTVNIYMTLTNKQSTNAVDAYRKWLLGGTAEDGGSVTGVGQEYAASLLGYSWERLVADGSIYVARINGYLEKFIEKEVESIAPNEEEGSRFGLNLKYFEFIGENVPA